MLKITDPVAATLEEAAQLCPYPAYANGNDYGDWYIEASPPLLLALVELARSQGSDSLTERLERLTHPLCMEPLDAVLPSRAMPERW
ncbi:hypothetical protein [Streptomyces clavifer]|uniref:hypothetical protein n=1 Tax=Streptomyces clavifer TaxID=68188 RepID=UPI00366A2A07